MVRPLVSAAWLNGHLGAEDVRLVDVRWYLAEPDRGRREYAHGHIPGAIFMDLETDLSAPTGRGRHPLPGPAEFATLLGRLGIGDAHHVVAYDSAGGAIASRLWWMLRHVGHHHVSVLDGGFEHWLASGFAVTGATAAYPPAHFSVRSVRKDLIEREDLSAQLGDVILLDARTAPRYRGESEPIDAAAGHIPTAINAPYAANLNADGSFKPPEELAARFAALGVEPDSEVVVSCGSGVTACHNILALHLAGYAEATLYGGSWSDWSAAGYPVATGRQPGGAPSRSR